MSNKSDTTIEVSAVSLEIKDVSYDVDIRSFTISDPATLNIAGVANFDKFGIPYYENLNQPATLNSTLFAVDESLVEALNKEWSKKGEIGLTYFDKQKKKNVLSLSCYLQAPIQKINANENSGDFADRPIVLLTRARDKLYDIDLTTAGISIL
jgi:hypothetical protein